MPIRRIQPSPAPPHAEGFAGQHLVVIPAPVRSAALGHPLLRTLLVTDAGYFPSAAGHRVSRPSGTGTHLLILCLRGEGWVRSGERTASVAPGDALWLPAGLPHVYGADRENPWTIVWVHFRGDEVAHWQAELGWSTRRPFAIRPFSAEILGSLGADQIYARLERGYGSSDLLAAAVQLRSVFAALIDADKSSGSARSASERAAAVRDALVANPLRAHRLEELATRAGLSVPHFCAVFRRISGYAPIDFLIRQRIRLACRLLDATDEPVSAIAARSGFEDPYYFSRSFRRVMGTSPREYRKTVKG